MSYDALNADQRRGSTLNGKPSLTIDQAAAQLTREGLSWASAPGSGATVTYAFRATAPATMPSDTTGFSQFTLQQISAAEAALKLWSSIANITFVRVATGSYGAAAYSDQATILFGNYSAGESGSAAFAYFPGSRNAQSAAGDVWVNSSILSNYYAGSGYGYGFKTLLHEIGHAIGLSHPSDYDASESSGDITYANNAGYAEDSLEYSLMSYFGITDSGGYATSNNPVPGTPLIDDVAAVQRLYGANAITNNGDTIYGYDYGDTIGPMRPDIHLQYSSPAAGMWGTIWDGGGNDTLDFSLDASYGAPSVSQKLDLRAGSFSNVLGGVGNLSIAEGVTIENAYGGSGNDTIIGNEVGNFLRGGMGADLLTGGGGADIFAGTTAELNGDRLIDLARGDRIRIDNASFGSFSYLHSGDTLLFNGAAMTIGTPNLRLATATSPGGGTDLVGVSRYTGMADFDGNGHSDLLWRNDNGAFSTWNLSGNAVANGFAANATLVAGASPDWKVAETFDWDGDGKSDLLWRNALSGNFSVWTGQGTTWGANAFLASGISSDWKIAGVGDLDGDGKDDIVWRNDAGTFSTWLSTGAFSPTGSSGGFSANAVVDNTVSSDWKIVGLADFDGDGKADLLWRNAVTGTITEWQSAGATAFARNVYVNATVGSDWHIDALADFNGDGRADILWRHDGDGVVTLWSSAGNGFTANTYIGDRVSPSWQIQEAVDVNDDGRADLVWRNMQDGGLSIWQSNGSGFDMNTALIGGVSTAWHIQAHDYLFG